MKELDKLSESITKLDINDKKINHPTDRLNKSNIESNSLITVLQNASIKYFEYDSRSPQKVNVLHNGIKCILEKYIISANIQNCYVKLEQMVPAQNISGTKRCDIVVYKDNIIRIVIPVKFIMSNYKQNKNNMLENLIGECVIMKHANKGLHIIPFNVIFNYIPYLDNQKRIKKFEKINYSESFKIYKKFIPTVISNSIDYVVNVDHQSTIGEKYTMPKLLTFNQDTPYIEIGRIVGKILS